ncbi:MAG: tRNA lysidine(34) synthetase TilS [bacterium]|nr:tRNA lysidine(34) synthetase TilS [bacterium]
MNQLYPQFKENILQHRLITPGTTVILGFSGGKDSVTLFQLLKGLRKEISFRLIAAYFNHKIRTDEAEEEKWIREYCDAQGVEYVIGGKNVMAFKTEAGLNLEHAASISRYGFFKEISTKYPAVRVATAHTKSDLTETFLIKLFRGSGLQGLSSIYSKKENTIIRPLLLFTQQEILSFLERNSISFYTDYTNRQDDFLRNRIRNRLVPEIVKIEPEIDNHVFRTVTIIQAEYDYFSEKAGEILKRGLILDKILPIVLIEQQHQAIQRHIVREYIRKLKGNLLNIGFQHIEELRTGGREKGGIAIPGIELAFARGLIYPRGLTVPEYAYHVKKPGTLDIVEIGKQLIIKEVKRYKKPESNDGIILPVEKLKYPLTIRSPRRGDKYIKLNTTINQRVFEMIRAAGKPADLRNLCPVVLNGDGELIWSQGSPVADNFKVAEPKEKNFIKIEIKPEESQRTEKA